jgi:NAD(P)-dependent dehydrogenase (short-subunit alcohol dehydrogenase family)
MTAILITGAARRIGRALALALAAHGYDIYAHYNVSTDDAASLATEIATLGRRCDPVRADLADAEDAGRLLGRCQVLGGVCHLVNNAAVYADDPPEGFSAAVFDRQIAIDLRAPLILADRFVRQAPPGGTILNMLDSRVAALPGGYTAYMAAKAGLAAATEMMALKYAPHVRVNAIAPGAILPGEIETAGQVAAFQARTPLAVTLGVDDIVGAAVYLLQARAVTGQILYVDGGHRLTARRSP